MLPVLGTTKESSVQRHAFDGRSGGGENALGVTMRPFGEAEGFRWSLVVSAPESDFTGDVRVAVQSALVVVLVVLLLGGAALRSC